MVETADSVLIERGVPYSECPVQRGSTVLQYSITNQFVSSLFLLCAIGDRQVATWGANDKGQLGLTDTNDRVTPTLVTFSGSFSGSVVCVIHYTIRLYVVA